MLDAAVLWPLPLQATDHFICPTSRSPLIAADLLLITWALAWDTHALLTHPLALFDAAYVPFALLRWRARLDRRRWIGLGAALLAAGVPALLASLPYLELQRLGLVPSGRSTMVDLALSSFITRGRIDTYLTNRGVASRRPPSAWC
jgi:hypothetical protein